MDFRVVSKPTTGMPPSTSGSFRRPPRGRRDGPGPSQWIGPSCMAASGEMSVALWDALSGVLAAA